MGKIWDDTFNEAGALFGLILGLGLLLFLGMAVAIAYYVLLTIILTYRYRQYQLAAGVRAEEIMDEHGTVRAENVTYAWWGVRPEGRQPHTIAEILWGVEEKES